MAIKRCKLDEIAAYFEINDIFDFVLNELYQGLFDLKTNIYFFFGKFSGSFGSRWTNFELFFVGLGISIFVRDLNFL